MSHFFVLGLFMASELNIYVKTAVYWWINTGRQLFFAVWKAKIAISLLAIKGMQGRTGIIETKMYLFLA